MFKRNWTLFLAATDSAMGMCGIRAFTHKCFRNVNCTQHRTFLPFYRLRAEFSKASTDPNPNPNLGSTYQVQADSQRHLLQSWMREKGIDDTFLQSASYTAVSRMTVSHCERVYRSYPHVFEKMATSPRFIRLSDAEWHCLVDRDAAVGVSNHTHAFRSYWAFVCSDETVFETGLLRHRSMGSIGGMRTDSYWALLAANSAVFERVQNRRSQGLELGSKIAAESADSFWAFLALEEDVYTIALQRRSELGAVSGADGSGSYWAFLSADPEVYNRALLRRLELDTSPKADSSDSYWAFLSTKDTIYRTGLKRRKELAATADADGTGSFWSFLSADKNLYNAGLTLRLQLKASARADSCGSYWSILRSNQKIHQNVLTNYVPTPGAEGLNSFWISCKADRFNAIDFSSNSKQPIYSYSFWVAHRVLNAEQWKLFLERLTTRREIKPLLAEICRQAGASKK